MFIRPSLRDEIRAALRLTFPLAGAQVAQAATSFVDTVMMGWLGQDVLAAGGLAATTFITLLVTASGIITGVSPLAAEAYGVANPKRIQQLTRNGLWLSLLLSLPVMGLLWRMDGLMEHLGQAPSVAILARPYLTIILWGFFPALAFALLKDVVSSLSHPQPVMVIVMAGTGLNVAGNYALGFGHFGLPALGLSGIALTSVISYWAMFIALVVYLLKQRLLKSYRLFQNLLRVEPQVLRELFWIGLPIGVSFALEIGLFTVTTYLMGALGPEVLAAHQIVFQTIAVIFMVPLGMSYATTIRVGQWNGQQNPAGVRRAAYVGMGLGGFFMILMALLLLLFPRSAIGLFLDLGNPNNAQVISLAISMFAVAAVSQILDGVQTTAAGALRGLKDTRVPMLLSFLAFWGVGLASGYTLGFVVGLGGIGLWLGQAIGVGCSAILFGWRLGRLI
ncbi:MATE family efflux transporter [Pseudanabaena sp. FACHB-2040]|uniref:MATE family efflux transporter n=1 Tax=Pseudanabaena sp. FACHB-2040 TaxID=2692859 RepID=UPI001684AF4F|nr:MATE family efflux transporter [Pseudanabaena sp. FACHB-2040]MBD2259755.1 MATE family efflux transporter [Pseudanabaena sp. FACHB-2040]